MKKYKGFALQWVSLIIMIGVLLVTIPRLNTEQTIANMQYLEVPTIGFWIVIGVIISANFLAYYFINKNKNAISMTGTSEGTDLYLFMADFLKLSEEQMRKVRNLYVVSGVIWVNILMTVAIFVLFYANDSNIKNWSDTFITFFTPSIIITIVFDIIGTLGLIGGFKKLIGKKKNEEV